MLIKKLKKLEYLNTAEQADIAIIVDEVKRHGFYSAHCASLVVNAQGHNDLIQKIQTMAASAQLSVSFNATGELCIFEASV